MRMIGAVGLAAAVAMPLWNIPLILKIERRKSSQDISVAWVMGVWLCIMLMVPSAMISPDPIFKAFSLVNAALFSAVAVQVIRYRA